MTRDTPIACSLTAEELPARLAEMSAIGADALLGGGEDRTLRFRNDEATRARLDAIIAAESECCSFFGFELRESGDQLELRVAAPEGAEPLAEALVHAFQEGARAGAGPVAAGPDPVQWSG